MKTAKTIPVSRAVNEWLAYGQQHFALKTQINYSYCLHLFLSSLPAITIDQLSPKHIDKFLNHLSKRLKGSSVNNHVIALKSFGRWLLEHYGLPSPAAKTKKVRTEPPMQRFLDETEYEKVLAVCRPKEKAVVEFLSNTGLRASEFLSLSKASVRDDMLYVLGKGQRPRTIPLNQTARQALEYLLFYSGNNTDVSGSINLKRTALYMMCYRLAKRAKLERGTFGSHALRRLFANRMRKHIDIYILSRLLGHASLQTTQIYLSAYPGELQGVTNVLDEGGKL